MIQEYDRVKVKKTGDIGIVVDIRNINGVNTSLLVKAVFCGGRSPLFSFTEFDCVGRGTVHRARSVTVTKPDKNRTGHSVHTYILNLNMMNACAVGTLYGNAADCAGINIRHKKSAIADGDIGYIKSGLRAYLKRIGAGNNLTVGN